MAEDVVIVEGFGEEQPCQGLVDNVGQQGAQRHEPIIDTFTVGASCGGRVRIRDNARTGRGPRP